jgi:hypothetical protein
MVFSNWTEIGSTIGSSDAVSAMLESGGLYEPIRGYVNRSMTPSSMSGNPVLSDTATTNRVNRDDLRHNAIRIIPIYRMVKTIRVSEEYHE